MRDRSLTSTHPVRVLVHSVDRKTGARFKFPPLVGCMLCLIRVESHDNLGMNIWDSVQTAVCVLVCSSVCSSLHELPVCRTEHPVTTTRQKQTRQNSPRGNCSREVRALKNCSAPQRVCLHSCPTHRRTRRQQSANRPFLRFLENMTHQYIPRGWSLGGVFPSQPVVPFLLVSQQR